MYGHISSKTNRTAYEYVDSGEYQVSAVNVDTVRLHQWFSCLPEELPTQHKGWLDIPRSLYIAGPSAQDGEIDQRKRFSVTEETHN